jgi:predicted small lipoprotein YifL
MSEQLTMETPPAAPVTEPDTDEETTVPDGNDDTEDDNGQDEDE